MDISSYVSAAYMLKGSLQADLMRTNCR